MLTVSAVAFAYPELISKRLAPLYDAVCMIGRGNRVGYYFNVHSFLSHPPKKFKSG